MSTLFEAQLSIECLLVTLVGSDTMIIDPKYNLSKDKYTPIYT